MSFMALKTSRDAVEFAANFGFLSRRIFFDELCRKCLASKYNNWNRLIERGWFRESAGSKDVLHLTKQGFAMAGPNPVRLRSSLYVNHDSIVGKFWLMLERVDLDLKRWTEGKLKQVPWDALGVVGGDNLEKIPDLVFEYGVGESTLRAAVEVETSRKAKLRYDQMAIVYSRLTRIKLIIFVCESKEIEEQITRAFDIEHYRKGKQVVATILHSELESAAFAVEARVGRQSIRLDQLLAKALKLKELPEKLRLEAS